MKKIVIYQSSTGFTKQYAEWISDELECEAVSLKNVTKTQVADAELVIFGGWIMGGMISGLDKMRKMNPTELFVFAVGSIPEDIVDINFIKETNHLGNEELYYMTGGFKFEKLNILIKGMLKGLKKSVAKKENKTPQEQFMAEALGTSFDYTDKKYILPLINEVKDK